MSDRFESFEEFWPYYVREHARKTTRVLHFCGTTAALATLGAAILTRRPALFALAPVVGYGPAWVGHFFVEKNRPATFRYPLWSLRADFVMFGKMIAGTMDDEVDQALSAEAERVSKANGGHEPARPDIAAAQAS
jgi:hypothetical protein